MNQNSSQNIQSLNKPLLLGHYHLPSSRDTKIIKTKGPRDICILRVVGVLYSQVIYVYFVGVC